MSSSQDGNDPKDGSNSSSVNSIEAQSALKHTFRPANSSPLSHAEARAQTPPSPTAPAYSPLSEHGQAYGDESDSDHSVHSGNRSPLPSPESNITTPGNTPWPSPQPVPPAPPSSPVVNSESSHSPLLPLNLDADRFANTDTEQAATSPTTNTPAPTNSATNNTAQPTFSTQNNHTTQATTSALRITADLKSEEKTMDAPMDEVQQKHYDELLGAGYDASLVTKFVNNMTPKNAQDLLHSRIPGLVEDGKAKFEPITLYPHDKKNNRKQALCAVRLSTQTNTFTDWVLFDPGHHPVPTDTPGWALVNLLLTAFWKPPKFRFLEYSARTNNVRNKGNAPTLLGDKIIMYTADGVKLVKADQQDEDVEAGAGSDSELTELVSEDEQVKKDKGKRKRKARGKGKANTKAMDTRKSDSEDVNMGGLGEA